MKDSVVWSYIDTRLKSSEAYKNLVNLIGENKISDRKLLAQEIANLHLNNWVACHKTFVSEGLHESAEVIKEYVQKTYSDKKSFGSSLLLVASKDVARKTREYFWEMMSMPSR